MVKRSVRLRHEYQRVSDLVMWRVAAHSLPELKIALRKLIMIVDTSNL